MPRREKIRERLNFDPEFNGKIAGWTTNYIHRNFWKFCSNYEFEDLVQEAYIKFLQCRDRYVSVREPAHFMSLYQTSIRNHFSDLAKKIRDGRQCVVYENEIGDGYTVALATLAGHLDNEGPRNILIRQAPKEVRRLISSMLDGGAEVFRRHKTLRRVNGGSSASKKLSVRETTNEFLCRLLRCDPLEVNVREMAISHFQHNSDDLMNDLIRAVRGAKWTYYADHEAG